MKYLKLFEQYNSGYNVGDMVEQNSKLEMYPLPDSQVPTEDGVYQLQYIPLDRTDIVISGQDKRSVFDEDDYDGYQTDTFNYMKDNFDSLPPIIFKEEKDGTYSHIDGHHRIIIAKELNRKDILAWVYKLDQSKDKVVNKPKPKFKTIKKGNEFLFNGDTWNDNKHVFFYKDKMLSGKDEFIKKWYGSPNKEDLKIMDKKFLPYLFF